MDISPSLYYFLMVLTQPMHGYQIMQEVEKASNGTLTMGAGTCYGLISRCLSEHLIELKEEIYSKKTYQITRKGRDILNGEIERISQLLSLTKTYLGDDHV